MIFIVDEEYGKRYWLWELEGDYDSLSSDDKSSITENFVSNSQDAWSSGFPSSHIEGTWTNINDREWNDRISTADYDAWAHLHTEEDSNIVWKVEG